MTEGRCVICKLGQLTPGWATMTFDDDDALTVVIRHVPAIGVCDSCGEAYFDEDTARAMLAQVPPRRDAVYSSWTTRPEPLGSA